MQDYKTLYATMKRIADAEPRDLDTWNIAITAGQYVAQYLLTDIQSKDSLLVARPMHRGLSRAF